MEQNLTKDSIYGLIRSIAIPASVGLIFTTLYNVVDTYFAGQQIGTEALAGITVVFPIYFILMALVVGVGSGSVALMAIALGENDLKKYHSLGRNSMVIALIVSICVFLLKGDAVKYLLGFMGSSGEALKFGADYLEMMFMGFSFFMFNGVLNAFLNAIGDTKSYRNFLIISFFVNAILDPLFVMGSFGLPKMGTFGLALATVLVQLIGTFYLAHRVYNSKKFDWELFKKTKVRMHYIKEIFNQGLPASLNTATIALGVFVINYFILKLAPGAVTIGAYGAAMRVEQLVLIPTAGLGIAALTITGQNYGAEKYERIFEVKNKAILIGTCFIVVGGIILFPLISTLIGIFDSNPEVVAAGTHYLRIEILALPTYVIANILINVLQGIKKPAWAVYIGLYRQIIMPIIIFELLINYFKMGITGVWVGIVIVNWSALIFTFIYAKYMMNKVLIVGAKTENELKKD
jgi:putative MATE family efflux protein